MYQCSQPFNYLQQHLQYINPSYYRMCLLVPSFPAAPPPCLVSYNTSVEGGCVNRSRSIKKEDTFTLINPPSQIFNHTLITMQSHLNLITIQSQFNNKMLSQLSNYPILQFPIHAGMTIHFGLQTTARHGSLPKLG